MNHLLSVFWSTQPQCDFNLLIKYLFLSFCDARYIIKFKYNGWFLCKVLFLKSFEKLSNVMHDTVNKTVIFCIIWMYIYVFTQRVVPCYAMVWQNFNIISYTDWWWKWDIYHILNSQGHPLACPHMWASHVRQATGCPCEFKLWAMGVFFKSFQEKFPCHNNAWLQFA